MTTGRLVVVGTPIGNLDDISPRAVRALREADVIYCEDTRRTRRLLSALGVPAPMLNRLDQHTELDAAAGLVDRVERGATVALVSDAGMPTVSDPGALVVREAADRGLAIEVVPGPSAVTAALAVSGLDARQYRFAGFLPRKGRDRREVLDSIAASEITVVLYESPARVVATVDDLLRSCGADRPFVAGRELTKLHEEVWRSPLGEAPAWLAAGGGGGVDGGTGVGGGTAGAPGTAPAPRGPLGEWVLLVGGGSGRPSKAGTEVSDSDIAAALAAAGAAAAADRRAAIAQVAADLHVPKRRVYAIAVATKASPPPSGL